VIAVIAIAIIGLFLWAVVDAAGVGVRRFLEDTIEGSGSWFAFAVQRGLIQAE
jgi:hypothetical protein